MPLKRRRASSRTAAHKTFELSLAAPQVIAHRTARMALAGRPLSARDRKEFTGMVLEKQLAFSRSWIAASQSVFSAQLALASWAWRHADSIASAALAPIHRKAVGNAKRLSRTSLVPRRRKR